MTNRQVMQQALEALDSENPDIQLRAALALRTALAQPEQEPVSCRFCHSEKGCWAWQCYKCGEIDDVQQPTPPAAQRQWVGLTEQDMPSGEDPMFDHKYFIAGLVYAAKVLQEKNND